MSVKRIVLRPRKGSGKFKSLKSISGISYTEERTDERGAKYVENAGVFEGERLPNTRGFRRPVFSAGKRMWLLKLDNGDYADQEWIDNLVPKCYLYYESGHPKEGEHILKANLRDINDPFFNHEELNHVQHEGVTVFEPDDPKTAILVAGERAMPDVGDARSEAFTSNSRYQLVDPQEEMMVGSQDVKRKMEAYKLLSNMGVQKKIIVAKIIFNRNFEEDPSEDILMTEFDNFIGKKGKISAEGRSYLEEFIHVAKLDGQRLELTERVKRAIRTSVIRKKQNQFVFDGKPLGTKTDHVINHFFSSENSEDLDKLLIKLGDE